MPKVSSAAQKVKTEKEGNDVLLSFNVSSETGDVIRVEMRGRRLCGVLESGHHVIINCGRDKYGVMHPHKIKNVTTGYLVRMESQPFRRLFRFLFSTGVSIATAVITNSVMNMLINKSKPLQPYSLQPHSAPHLNQSASSGMEPAVLAVAIVLGVLVFYLTYIRGGRR